MEKLNAMLLIKDARQKLQGKNVRTMAMIHTGVIVAASVLITLLQYVLEEGVAGTGGLSGMGTRSLLQTAQTVLQWANVVLAPFWNLGFLYVAMQWARGNAPQKEDLLMGFHRVGPCLGLLLNRSVLTFCVVFLCVNLCTTFYMMLPASAKITDIAAAAGNDVNVFYASLEGMSQAQQQEVLNSMMPLLIAVGLLSLVLLVPLLYRFRLAEYAILNQKGLRAMPAMIVSTALMHRRCWQFFKIDLRLWWYHGLKVLCSLILYGDLLLSALGVALPVSGETAYFVTYFAYLAALFAVEVSFRPYVETVYAGAYETLMAMGPVQKKQAPVAPQKMPWDEP